MTISRVDFRRLVVLCQNYDAFVQYIDDYKQMQKAREANKRYTEEFINTVGKYGIEVKVLPFDCINAGSMTPINLKKWFDEQGFEIEKRVWTPEEIRNYIQINDNVLYSAIMKLYAEQTADEQRSESTTCNGVGFNSADAKFLSGVAEYYSKHKTLSEKQKAKARQKLIKYTKQLTRLANA